MLLKKLNKGRQEGKNLHIPLNSLQKTKVMKSKLCGFGWNLTGNLAGIFHLCETYGVTMETFIEQQNQRPKITSPPNNKIQPDS